MRKKVLVICTTDSMIWNFLVPHIQDMQKQDIQVDCACSRTGDFFRNLQEKYCLNLHEIDFKRNPFRIGNFKAYKSLKKIVKENNYDVIFCHEPIGGLMGRLVGNKFNIKVIYMAHGFHFYHGAPIINKMLYYPIEKFFSKFTDCLITINQEDYNAAQKFKAKKTVLFNGIGLDTSKFVYKHSSEYIRNIIHAKADDFILLSVGELIKRKNHEVVIKAIAKLKNVNIHYVIAGDGPMKKRLNALIEKLRLQNQIHLLGYRTDINLLCNSADVFIIPSIQEGLSIALMEAMACGCPIIASKIRGNIDLLDDNGGVLINTFDVSGYAKSIESFANGNQKENLYKMGIYNIEKVKQFDIQNVRMQMEAIDLIYGG